MLKSDLGAVRLSALAVTVVLTGTIIGANIRAFSATAPSATSVEHKSRADFRRPTNIPFPAKNPYTPEKARLGRMLFFDTRL